MPPPYTSYAALAAEQTEGVDYQRRHAKPKGWSWLSTAVHGGGIEAGTSEIAEYVAGSRMGFYAFEGIKSSGNGDLHITSTLIDYPDLLTLLPSTRRFLSFHGYAGTAGVAEVAIGGLDGELVAAATTALTAAGFTVITAPSEIAGSDPDNICNKGLTRVGCQLELSSALRESFFPGGDLSAANRATGIRTAAFYAFGDALRNMQFLLLNYEPPTSKVGVSGNPVGVYDTFTRTVSSTWGTSDSGHTWTTAGGSASDYSTASGQGQIAANSVNVSRWATVPTGQADFDVSASVATSALATGGSHFFALAGRFADVDNTYLARLEFTTAQVVNLTIRKRVGGTETLIGSTVNTGLTHGVGTRFAVRFRGSGTTLQAKVWLASGAEPGAWTVTETDSSITTGYRVGGRSILSSANTNTLPVTYTIDDIRTLGSTSLQRSTDASTWAPVDGADALAPRPATLTADDSGATGDTPNWYRIQQLDETSGAVLLEGDQESLTPALDTTGITINATEQTVFPPRVLVSVTGMTGANITTVTLYRQVGADRTVVRAADKVDVTGEGALLRVDGEQPFGVPVTYIAALTDGTGAQAEVSASPVTLTVDSDVISDTIRGIGVKVQIASWPDKKREREAVTFNVGGRTVVVSRPRSSASATILVRTQTAEQGDALDEVLASATEGVILIRKQVTMPGVDGHLAVLTDTEDRNWYDSVRRWSLDSVETEPWPDVLEAAGFTLQDIADNYTTLKDIADDNATLLILAQKDFGV